MNRNYTDAALLVSRRVLRIAVQGMNVRSDERERELLVEIATAISEKTADQPMRLALELIELRATDSKVSDRDFRALVTSTVADALHQVREATKNNVDPHRVLNGVSS